MRAHLITLHPGKLEFEEPQLKQATIRIRNVYW